MLIIILCLKFDPQGTENFIMLVRTLSSTKCDGLRDLIPFVQFKNVKNSYGGVLLLVQLQTEAICTV